MTLPTDPQLTKYRLLIERANRFHSAKIVEIEKQLSEAKEAMHAEVDPLKHALQDRICITHQENGYPQLTEDAIQAVSDAVGVQFTVPCEISANTVGPSEDWLN